MALKNRNLCFLKIAALALLTLAIQFQVMQRSAGPVMERYDNLTSNLTRDSTRNSIIPPANLTVHPPPTSATTILDLVVRQRTHSQGDKTVLGRHNDVFITRDKTDIRVGDSAKITDSLDYSKEDRRDSSSSIYLGSNVENQQGSSCSHRYQSESVDSRLVVMWTPFWHSWDAWEGFMGAESRLREKRCPFWRCEFEWTEEGSTRRVEEADAVVFFSMDLFSRPLPPRRPHQLWILLELEAPPISQTGTGPWALAEENGVFFNMTMSYHHFNPITTHNIALRPLDLSPDCPSTEGYNLNASTATFREYKEHLENYDKVMAKRGGEWNQKLLEKRWKLFSHVVNLVNVTQSGGNSLDFKEGNEVLESNPQMKKLLDNHAQNMQGNGLPSMGNEHDSFQFRGKEVSTWISRQKLAVWMASNCQTDSRREKVIAALQQFIKVTTVGQCGKLSCGKNYLDSYCYRWLSGSHLFYLSFENALCEDYVTEKLWRPMEYGMVPVVYGGANYSAILPPGSYVDAFSFPNIEALAKHLIHLANHPVAYLRYLQWQRYWRVTVPMHWLCNLCHVLHKPNEDERRVIELEMWWNKTSDCYEPLL